MSGQVTQTSSATHVNRELRAEFDETPEKGFVSTAVSLQRDEYFESSEYREGLRDGEGVVSILVTAGDAIGEISITVQYEGQKGQHELCLQRQGDVLNTTCDWMKNILSEFETDWEVDLTTAACPKGDTRLLRISQAIERLTGVQVQPAVEVSSGPRIERLIKIESKQ
jgi:hypothetical protein